MNSLFQQITMQRQRSAWMTGALALFALLTFSNAAMAQDIRERVEHKYAVNDGTKIHYAKMGSGPLIVFIHGFPDFWYSWRHQMNALAADYTVAAMDTRGYNLSDQPTGVENYDMQILIEDVASVIRSEGQEDAVIVGHDWGGGIAWSFAGWRPEMTNRLIIMNLPHLKGFVRELAKFEDQHRNSTYARNFQSETSHEAISAAGLATALSRGDETLHPIYLEAFERSSADAMMNYYRANFPREPYTSGAFVDLPRIQMPVLQFHGMNDTALLPDSLNDTWDELDQDWTLVTVPEAGHWPHHDKPDVVTNMMRAWLALHAE
jgi:pimeloyl-ACP methyl ester carboxylesterase